MLRTVILAASRSSRVERLVETAPLTRSVVRRFVAGNTAADALRCTRELVNEGLGVSLDYLGEDTTTPEHAAAAKDEYLALLDALAAAELTPAAEISVKLSALGQVFDEKVAYEHAKAICARAAEAGTTVTLDAEEHTTTDSTLDILAKLRTDFPTVGAVLQAYLRRTEADCRELATAGSRVRLCKGAYNEPESVAFGEDRARWFDRSPDEFEFQMLYGVRPDEQRRLAAEGYTMRVYVPYGTQWYAYLMRRLAERPANLAFFLRALRSRD